MLQAPQNMRVAWCNASLAHATMQVMPVPAVRLHDSPLASESAA